MRMGLEEFEALSKIEEITDVTATILASLEIPIPNDMDGKIL